LLDSRRQERCQHYLACYSQPWEGWVEEKGAYAYPWVVGVWDSDQVIFKGKAVSSSDMNTAEQRVKTGRGLKKSNAEVMESRAEHYTIYSGL
jgi:hypothetical protein